MSVSAIVIIAVGAFSGAMLKTDVQKQRVAYKIKEETVDDRVERWVALMPLWKPVLTANAQAEGVPCDTGAAEEGPGGETGDAARKEGGGGREVNICNVLSRCISVKLEKPVRDGASSSSCHCKSLDEHPAKPRQSTATLDRTSTSPIASTTRPYISARRPPPAAPIYPLNHPPPSW